MIIGKFKKYYESYEDQKSRKIKSYYEDKLRKLARDADKCLPEDLMEVCVEKEKELTQQAKRKRNKTLRM